MTVMKIQLPTGVEAHLEDLRQASPTSDADDVIGVAKRCPPQKPCANVLQFRDTMEPVISHYELQGTTVVIQMDSVSTENTRTPSSLPLRHL